MDISSL